MLCIFDYMLFAVTAKFKGTFVLSNHLQLRFFFCLFFSLDDKLQSVACVIQQKYFQSSLHVQYVLFFDKYFSALYKVTEIIPKLVCKIQTEPPDHFMCSRRCLTFFKSVL